MSSNRLTFDGLEQLKTDLRNLPAALAGDAVPIVHGAAEAAANDIIAKYPARTGNLRKGVKLTKMSTGPFGTGAVVKNTAKHAYIFEVGTQARHNSIGANRGSMPEGKVFVPIVIRKRRAMYAELKAMLVRQGATVTGDA